MFRVTIKRSAERELRRIDRAMISRIVTAIHSLAENPHPSGSRKLVGSEAENRIQIGDYRIIYAVDNDAQSINISASVIAKTRTSKLVHPNSHRACRNTARGLLASFSYQTVTSEPSSSCTVEG